MAEIFVFFFSSRRRHTRLQGDWSSDVCSSDLDDALGVVHEIAAKPKSQRCPGFGFCPMMGWPRKKLPQVRVGAAGAGSLNAVSLATKGVEFPVLLSVLPSGDT